MSDWFLDNFGWTLGGVLLLMVLLLIVGGISEDHARQAMIGKPKDAIIQAWGPPSSVTLIQGGEVDTWAQYHAESTTYIMQSTGNGGSGVAVPITNPAYTERTVVTFINGIATRVEHP